MITIKQESVLIKKIKSLSELEFEKLFEEIAQHVHANRWHHIIENSFSFNDMSDRVDELEDELSKAEEKLSDFKVEVFDLAEDVDDLDPMDDNFEKQKQDIVDSLKFIS